MTGTGRIQIIETVALKLEIYLCCGGEDARRLWEELLEESFPLQNSPTAAQLNGRLVFVVGVPVDLRGPLVNGRGHLDTAWSIFSLDNLCLIRESLKKREVYYISPCNRISTLKL